MPRQPNLRIDATSAPGETEPSAFAQSSARRTVCPPLVDRASSTMRRATEIDTDCVSGPALRPEPT
eukprot:5987213-Pyramimonas_sp.AAC.1